MDWRMEPIFKSPKLRQGGLSVGLSENTRPYNRLSPSRVALGGLCSISAGER